MITGQCTSLAHLRFGRRPMMMMNCSCEPFGYDRCHVTSLWTTDSPDRGQDRASDDFHLARTRRGVAGCAKWPVPRGVDSPCCWIAERQVRVVCACVLLVPPTRRLEMRAAVLVEREGRSGSCPSNDRAHLTCCPMSAVIARAASDLRTMRGSMGAQSECRPKRGM